MTLVIIFICSFIAFSLSALCGGGAGLILMPLLGRLLPVSQIPATLSIGTFTSSASRLVVFRKSINWHIVRYFLPAALPAVALGAFLLKYVNPLYLQIAMAIFLIGNLPFVFAFKKKTKKTHKTSNLKLTIIGFLAGFLSGFTGAVGLLFNRFYLHYGLTKEQIVATRAANDIILHLIKIILYFFLGLVSSKVVYLGIVVAVSGILSTWTMKWLLPKLSEGLFKRTGYAAMALSGFVMLGQSGTTLMSEKGAHFAYEPISNGVETKLLWRQSGYSLEFAIDEGIEFEQIIPMAELTVQQKNLIKSKKADGERIIVEAVYTFGPVTYEAYYFLGRSLTRKIDFDGDGKLVL